MTCARCGAKLREGGYVYSSWTKNRYCSSIDKCGKRAKRLLPVIVELELCDEV